ncbi:DUF3575 domain-containing protein [Flavobacteriaceae bacterium F08102]|nr:DUF3575 domain-containing protein [Flavobacteriaceae bacterium F08102]
MKIFVTICIFFCSISLLAQEELPQKKYEFNINVFNTIIFKAPELSFEYLIDAESSIGSSIMLNLTEKEDNNAFIDGPNYHENVAFTAYYRRFFSSKYAWGFFIETFGMYNQQEVEQYINDSFVKTNNFAVGISVGGKWVSSKGFVFQIHGGVGRNIISSDDVNNTELVPRLGASFGLRF